jgi:hypothetical protein
MGNRVVKPRQLRHATEKAGAGALHQRDRLSGEPPEHGLDRYAV